VPQDFVHLHNHSQESLLDGLDPVEQYVQRAKALNQSALAITDHGVMCGAPQFYQECVKAGIKPILGSENYFVNNAEVAKADKIAGERHHITMIARNEAGFRLLVELNDAAHRNFYYKPLLDRPLLEGISRKDAKNITVLSGCMGSVISQKILKKVEGDPVEEIEWWSGIFPNFYIELMHHGCDDDRRLNRGLLKAARHLELPWVITNDPHFVLKEDAWAQDALLAVQTGADIDDPKRFKFEGEGYWLKSRAEMRAAFRRYGDEVWKPGAANTLRIAAETDIRIPDWDNRSWHIPKFKDAVDSDALLSKLARKGLRRRHLQDKPQYVGQMEHELGKFAGVPGMADFLLIIWDVIRWARKQGIRIGPGRGSVAGSLVGYLIGLHRVDSVKHNLLFERFLNPERPKMPDIDTDVPPADRGRIIQYVIDTYGEENVAHVAAFGTMKLKRAFQSLAGVHGIPFAQRMALSKKIEEDEEGGIIWPDEVVTGYPSLIRQIDRIAGIKGSISSHPAGILIFDPDDDVRKYVPSMWVASGKGHMVAQYDLKSTDFMFLLKQDILGLRNLATIDVCVASVAERYGVEVEPDDWIPDEEPKDDKVYAMLAAGKVNGVFQMEGYACRGGIQKVGCTQFNDLCVVTSMYRAGPIGAGAPKRYLENRADGVIRVIHPSMKEILSKTWGEMLYQEQMFRILNELAGLSWARVDDVKTAVTKKNAVMMEAVKDDTVRGLRKTSGFSSDQAEQMWEVIGKQATYLFAETHAVAYSYTTYATARLKHLYPLEYLAACLATVEGKNDADKAKRHSYLSEAVQRGYRVLPPCINRSSEHARPEGRDGIRLGFVDIKGVGEAAARKILDRRPEEGFTKKWQAKGATASNVFTGLREAGALQDLGMPPDPGLQETRLAWQFYDPLADHRDVLEQRHKPAKGDGGYATLCGIIVKVDKRKTKKGNHFMKWTIRWKPGEEYAITLWDSTEGRLWKLKEGSIVTVSGRWSAQWSNMAIDDEDSVRVRVAVLEGGSAAPARS
jgi:DNA polymerase III subunit alpha